MPGVNLIFESEQTQQPSPTSPGKAFFVGQTERGSVVNPILVNSLAEFTKQCGATAQPGSFMQPAVEEFFQEGGQSLYVARVVGSGATAASVSLVGSAGSGAVTITANSPGTWGNKLEANVIAGEVAGTTTLQIKESGTLIEQYLNIATRKALDEANEERIALGKNPIVVITAGAAGEVDPPSVTAAKSLTGGTEGEAIKNSQFVTGLKIFNEELGIGQVAVPGVSAQVVQEGLLSHAEKNNRVAFVDFAVQVAGESNEVYQANIEGARNQLKGLEGQKRSSGFSSWARIPGKAPNTTVLCPWSAVQAGIIARNDSESEPPRVNQASAGIQGIPRNVSALVTVYKRPERDKLNENGITPIRLMPNGEIETYGVKTFANTEKEPAWQQLTAARLFMFVAGEGTAILEKAVLKEIDSHGFLLNKIKGELQRFMERIGIQLFNNPAESVNVGPTVNTKETLAKNEVVAAVAVKPNKAAEVVTLRLAAQA